MQKPIGAQVAKVIHDLQRHPRKSWKKLIEKMNLPATVRTMVLAPENTQ